MRSIPPSGALTIKGAVMENKKILEVSNLTISFKTNDGLVHAVRDVDRKSVV